MPAVAGEKAYLVPLWLGLRPKEGDLLKLPKPRTAVTKMPKSWAWRWDGPKPKGKVVSLC